VSVTSSVTLSFFDERLFLTVIQPVLLLHVCADPTPTESATTGTDYATDSAVEPLHSIADSAVVGANLTETS
jgi:hypothetical protein